MSIIFIISSIILLSIITYQDFKFRAISWFLIPLLLISIISNGLLKISLEEYTTYTLINLFILIINLFGATLIISIKERKLTNIIDSYIGLGDILFFVVLTTFFSPFNFLAFYIGSIFIGIITSLVLKLNRSNKSRYFPLAGTLSLLLIAAIMLQLFIPSLQFYNDFIFLI